MKKFLLSLSLVFLSAAASIAQSTASTPPVGFITTSIQGASGGAPGLTLVSPTLTNAVAFQGVIASVSGNTITITGANFTAGQYSGTNAQGEPLYYAEIFSASQAGVLSDVTGTGAYNSGTNTSTITTAQNLSLMISAGESIAIRQHVTINQFLGAGNTYGFQASTSGDATTGDEVLVYSGAQQSTYFYYGGGWYDANTGNPAGSDTIEPYQGVLIYRRGSGNLTLTSMGTVKAGNTLFPIVGGVNYLGTLSAQGLTLDTSGLISSGLTGGNSGDATTSDQVYLYSGGQQFEYFYYTGSPGAGWYDTTNGTPSGSVALPPGASILVKRINGGAFNWTMPIPSSF